MQDSPRAGAGGGVGAGAGLAMPDSPRAGAGGGVGDAARPRRTLTLRPMGERALLAETGSLEETLGLHAALAASRPDGVVELVPAARTVLVVVDPRRLSPAAARSWILHAPPAPAAASGGDEVVVDVVYDGPDLDETAALVGIRPAELIRRHADAAWTVAFTGFAPGFGYLVRADWPFDVPRLASPRTRVPAGAVGLAAGFTGAYPRATPGGWRLIGTTDAPLFDTSRPDPALLTPGARVRMRPVPPTAVAAPAPAPAPAPARLQPRGETAGADRSLAAGLQSRGQEVGGEGGSREGFVVVATGPLATVQDLGRPGAAALGVARSGALDRAALRAAHRLVGDPEHAAGIEVTLGGFEAVASRDLWVAVAGAWGPIRIAGAPVDPYVAHAWPAGAALWIGAPEHGIRSYLAVRGGVDVAAVLGSRATDTLAGLGPAALRPGDVLAVGPEPPTPVPPIDLAPWSPPGDELELAARPGPRADWLADPQRLFDEVWTVSDRADRVGIRLDGTPLVRAAGEVPSEGMVPGAVQLPPDGRPVILLADGPVTGGYPVIAVVTDAALDLLAQARPGTRLRFRHARPAS